MAGSKTQDRVVAETRPQPEAAKTLKTCATCCQALPKASYSKNQWAKKENFKCAACIGPLNDKPPVAPVVEAEEVDTTSADEVPEGLEYAGSDHVVAMGKRTICNAEHRSKLPKGFLSPSISKCPMCARDITEGDFALEHTMFKKLGDESNKVVKVRSMPRIWCYPCSKENAKNQRKTRIATRGDPRPLYELWQEHSEAIRNGTSSGEVTRGHAEFGAGPAQPAHDPLEATPVVSVGDVMAGSPASEAGLLSGDTITNFGGLTAARFKGVAESIVPVVSKNEGKPITVEVIRLVGNSQIAAMNFTLTPRKWAGGGLLGCILHPAV